MNQAIIAIIIIIIIFLIVWILESAKENVNKADKI